MLEKKQWHRKTKATVNPQAVKGMWQALSSLCSITDLTLDLSAYDTISESHK